MLQVNGMPDHIHLFIGMRPSQSLSDLMKRVKGDSSEWINKKGFTRNRFSWQAGYGAFSYAKSQVPNVIRYIQHQEEHHRKKTFTEEYLDFLTTFEVEYDDRFVFQPVL
jgi:REP element-mobilizing transposase RayT